MQKSEKTERNFSLEGMRIWFMIYMILHHLDMFNEVPIADFSNNLKDICFEGFIGVNFFFMLSGLGCTIGYRKKLLNEEISPLQFLCKRIVQLWPTYILFFVMALILYGGYNVENIKYIFLDVFMLQAFPMSEAIAFMYNGVAWCISVEFFFYIIFCFCYGISFKKCLYFTILILSMVGINFMFPNIGKNMGIFYINPIFRSLEFFVGMLIGLWFEQNKNMPSSKLQIVSILTLVSFVIIGIYGEIPLYYRWSVYYVFPFALLIYSFYGETKFSKILFGNKYTVYLSKYILVMYLIHQEFFFVMKQHLSAEWHQILYENFVPWGIITMIIAIILLSIVVSKCITIPATNIFKKFLLRI